MASWRPTYEEYGTFKPGIPFTSQILHGFTDMDRRTSHRPQRVLIADDSADIREMWRLWLTFWGFEVEEAQNGSDAVDKVRAHQPDLVLMDVWMPVLDGLSATAELKSDPTTARIPILALSAHTVPTAVDRAIAVGCDSFLPKPVDPDQLLDQIRRVFGRLKETGAHEPETN